MNKKEETLELLNDIIDDENFDFDTIMKKLEILKNINLEDLLKNEEE